MICEGAISNSLVVEPTLTSVYIGRQQRRTVVSSSESTSELVFLF